MSASVTERIDRIVSESPIGLSAASRIFGTFRLGKPTSPATLFRWCTEGVKFHGGRRVYLEHIRLGNRLMTSRAACMRFLEAQQTEPTDTASDSAPTTSRARTPAASRKSSGQAAAKLAAMGA